MLGCLVVGARNSFLVSNGVLEGNTVIILSFLSVGEVLYTDYYMN